MKSHPDSFIIGIDACLGERESIGEIHVKRLPHSSWKRCGDLPEVGNVSIVGIIDSNEYSNFLHAHTVRLNFVMEMANVISNAILDSYNKFKEKILNLKLIKKKIVTIFFFVWQFTFKDI